MASSRKHTGKGKGKQPAPKSKRLQHDDDDVEYTDFESTLFPDTRLASCFYLKFMWRMVLTCYFVEMDCTTTVRISNKNLMELLEKVSWVNALIIKDENNWLY